MFGRIKMFNPDRGFGFIASDEGGPDIFVHANTARRAGIETLSEGQRVIYEAEVNPRDGRLRASEIALVPASSSPHGAKRSP